MKKKHSVHGLNISTLITTVTVLSTVNEDENMSINWLFECIACILIY